MRCDKNSKTFDGISTPRFCAFSISIPNLNSYVVGWISATRPHQSLDFNLSCTPSKSEGDLSAEITICLFCSIKALKV